MKILYILDSLNRGGSEVFALDVCRNAKNHGIDLMLAATGGGALEEEFKNSGVRSFWLKRRLPIDISLILSLRKIIKDNQIDILHAHQAVEGIHGYLAALGTKAKLVLSYHGGTVDKKSVAALKFIVHRTSRNVFVSNSLSKWYSENLGIDAGHNFSILYNGVEESRLKPTSTDFKQELNIPSDAILMGMIGNFYEPDRKDQMTICRALPKVYSDNEKAYFVFVGKVSDAGKQNLEDCKAICIKSGIADRVFFLGERNDVMNITAALDIFVFSSFREGMPIAVIEAMLSGLPLVLSDIEPLLEISDNGENALIFRSGDAEDLAQKINKLLKDSDLMKELADKARRSAKEKFTLESHFKELKKLYESVSNQEK